jgi:hypothetical protein
LRQYQYQPLSLPALVLVLLSSLLPVSPVSMSTSSRQSLALPLPLQQVLRLLLL